MSTKENSENDDEINRMDKKQQEVEAKENEIEEAIENASDKTVKESKKEARAIGDSDRE
jgi:Tfp pilus assembly protein PilN